MPNARKLNSLDMAKKIKGMIAKDIKNIGDRRKEVAQNDIKEFKNIGLISSGNLGLKIALKIK